jgi:hypothetical protein
MYSIFKDGFILNKEEITKAKKLNMEGSIYLFNLINILLVVNIKYIFKIFLFLFFLIQE